MHDIINNTHTPYIINYVYRWIYIDYVYRGIYIDYVYRGIYFLLNQSLKLQKNYRCKQIGLIEPRKCQDVMIKLFDTALRH